MSSNCSPLYSWCGWHGYEPFAVSVVRCWRVPAAGQRWIVLCRLVWVGVSERFAGCQMRRRRSFLGLDEHISTTHSSSEINNNSISGLVRIANDFFCHWINRFLLDFDPHSPITFVVDDLQNPSSHSWPASYFYYVEAHCFTFDVWAAFIQLIWMNPKVLHPLFWPHTANQLQQSSGLILTFLFHRETMLFIKM